MPSTVLIMGPPGAGKGTQSSHLVETFGLRHLATGDVLRSAVNAGTELGTLANEYMQRGDLVPDEVVIGVLGEMVATLRDDEGVLLDGFPRTRAQAESLDETLGALGRAVTVALDIAVPEDVLVERLSGRWICRTCQTPYNVLTNPPTVAGVCDRDGGELYQRDDDTPDSVRKRLAVYAEQTAPVASYYAERGVLETIDGDQAMQDVQAALDAAVVQHA